MSDEVKIALIVAAGPVVIAIANLVLTRKVSDKIEKVHTEVQHINGNANKEAK